MILSTGLLITLGAAAPALAAEPTDVVPSPVDALASIGVTGAPTPPADSLDAAATQLDADGATVLVESIERDVISAVESAGITIEPTSGAPSYEETAEGTIPRVVAPEALPSPASDEGASSPTGDRQRADGAAAGEATKVPSGSKDGENADRYHIDNSRYQDHDAPETDTWIWNWILQIDCAGNVVSTTRESGTTAAANWTWDWAWDWCADALPSVTSAVLEHAPREMAGPSPAPAPEIDTDDGSRREWRWSFSICGGTPVLSAGVTGGTTRTWAWDWSWTWTCPSESSATTISGEGGKDGSDVSPGGGGHAWVPPTPATLLAAAAAPAPTPPVAVAEPVADSVADSVTDTVTGPTTLAQLVGESVAGVGALLTAELLSPPLPPSPERALVAALDVEGSVVEAREAPFARERPMAAPVRPTVVPAPVRPTALPTVAALGQAASAGDERGAPGKERRAQRVSARPAPDPRLPPLLPGPPASKPHSYGAGSVVPGAPAFLAGVLLGLLVLTVPGVGRRIVAARELRPRSVERPPIDHPG